jgi:Cyclic nucleotide-binding domain
MSVITEMFPHLIHLGAILYLVCFLFRDQVKLRSFAILGDFAYTLYYFTVASEPLWEAIVWIVPNILINSIMIFLLLRDSRMTAFSDDEMLLFQNLRGLTPGQFRRLLKMGRWQRPTEPQVLTQEGGPLDRLYYVLQGDVEVDKGGRKIAVSPAIFIGELAYLRKKPATATVTAKPGAVLISWSHADLAKTADKDSGFGHVLGALLSSDLAEKVARS